MFVKVGICKMSCFSLHSLEEELSQKCVCTSGPVLAEEPVPGSVNVLVLTE